MLGSISASWEVLHTQAVIAMLLLLLFSGWQPRWFLLCGGILSYYDSPEDAWKGCKGSIQMAVCEIQVHSVDNTRMDLIIPGEQYFYLKARSVAERQRWLVALGSAKACLTDSRTQKEKEFAENTENLKTKMSELRLYCDLLVQQVDKTKEVTTTGVSNSEEGIDVGTLLKSTCNTFLKTLEECMQIANAAFTSELLYRTPPGSPQLAMLKSSKMKHPIIPIHNSLERQMELSTCENGSLNMEINGEEEILMKNKNSLSLKSAEIDCSISSEENTDDNITVQGEIMKEDGIENLKNHDNNLTQSGSDSSCSPECLWEEGKEVIPTFFSTMNTSFSDIELLEDSGIPTEAFLASCYAVVPVLDKLGPTVFAPVKMDLVGNIKKVNQKYITNKEEFTTLQKIVLHEVEADVAQVRNSATEALLWLKRGLKFLKGFLTEVKNGEKDIQTALSFSSNLVLDLETGPRGCVDFVKKEETLKGKCCFVTAIITASLSFFFPLFSFGTIFDGKEKGGCKFDIFILMFRLISKKVFMI
uniref:Pleckstrin homology domain-containing family A member 8 n=1 Tax=Macaca fascicularis TaxID=9541 RepID=A0A2K5X0C0_MACFA